MLHYLEVAYQLVVRYFFSHELHIFIPKLQSVWLKQNSFCRQFLVSTSDRSPVILVSINTYIITEINTLML